MELINALGRRKSAVARVYVSSGKGNIIINEKPLEEYFKDKTLQYVARQAMELTETSGMFDVNVNLVGGGLKGQSEALRLAVSRALCKIDAEQYRPVLKSNGLLTRDPREVERKKPGQPGARKRFQFSKR
jgi:small subunit ribosomal protein S9